MPVNTKIVNKKNTKWFFLVKPNLKDHLNKTGDHLEN